ncbi:MAG TPA: hypothetical protein PLK94_06795 [Alphaproteobacteria bacterium]|nr:hypothetical protein [Alphaproteobacteria bacterium]HPQ43826.1 hypothetical protein [Syntrophales bacterium]
MNIADMRFPRQLEADGSAEHIRGGLMERTSKLWIGGTIEVPVITLSKPMKTALKQARLQGRVRFGFEPILQKLASERKGITNVREQADVPYRDRISRLLLFSNDGAERFYRHIEQALEVHAPRLLGCLLDIDGAALGELFTGRGGSIKIIMAEHKDVVSDVLRAFVSGHNGM